MNKRLISILASGFVFFSANAQENPLDVFHNLVNKTWKAEGGWKDGTSFRQEITFEYDLDRHIVIARSKGFTNKEQTKYGNRNFGIRWFDHEKKAVVFTEHNVFGGVTTGKVLANDDQIIYSYEYEGYALADIWEELNDSTYAFTVGSYENGRLKDEYLTTRFKLYRE